MKTIFFSVLVSVFISCNSQKKVQSNNAIKPISEMPKASTENVYPKQTQGTIRLSEGENKFLKEQQMNITFLQIVEDNRCPKDVDCVQAGSATVEIELMTTTSRPRKFQLSIGDLKDNKTNSIEFLGDKITLQNLYPNASTDFPFEKRKGKYIVDLKVENQ
ncbi:MAG: hypothetical protein Q4G16_08085 [Cruoricaptor ignavus]|nr:hypothetical protein [Cruoricaptor ignavus]